MKKEKTVRTYQRRTKTGKLVTVKQHTAKYDAAEMLKEAAKKKGAGEELEKLKKKAQVKPTVEPEVKDDALGFTSDEFKQWYHWDMENDPKNKAAKKVEKALKEKMGAKGYKQYFNEMTEGYSARGHNKAFKEISLNTDDPRETAAKMAKYESKKVTSEKETNSKSKAPKGKGFDNEKSFSQNFPKELRQYIDSRNFSLKKKPTKSVEQAFNDAGFEIHHNDVEGIWEPTRNGMRYKETDWSAKNKAERAEKSDVVKWAKANGYSLRKDGMFQLKADSKKSRHEIYTLKDLEAKMGADKKSSPSANMKSVAKDIKAAQESVEYFTKMLKDKGFSSLSKKDQQHYKAKLAAEKALLKTLRSGKVSSDVDEEAQKAYDEAYKRTLKETKAKKEVTPTKKTKSEESATKSNKTPETKSFTVTGLRLNPSYYNERRTMKFDPDTGEIYGVWDRGTKERRLTRHLYANNRSRVADVIEKKFGVEARNKFLNAATEGKKDADKIVERYNKKAAKKETPTKKKSSTTRKKSVDRAPKSLIQQTLQHKENTIGNMLSENGKYYVTFKIDGGKKYTVSKADFDALVKKKMEMMSSKGGKKV